MQLEKIEYNPNTFPNFQPVMEQMVDILRKKEEEILISVLKHRLKRELVPCDGKRLTKLYYENSPPLEYDLAFDGHTIGHVKFETDHRGLFETITFYPC